MLNLIFFCYFSLFSALKFRYMSQALLRVARENSSVVAVVGKGHLSGIKKNWMQPVEVICSLLIFVLRRALAHLVLFLFLFIFHFFCNMVCFIT